MWWNCECTAHWDFLHMVWCICCWLISWPAADSFKYEKSDLDSEWNWSYMILDVLFVLLLWAFLYPILITPPSHCQRRSRIYYMLMPSEVRKGGRWAEGTFSSSPPPTWSELRRYPVCHLSFCPIPSTLCHQFQPPVTPQFSTAWGTREAQDVIYVEQGQGRVRESV